MAFYAEMKRRHWYRVNGYNMIIWYSNKLYDEWWDSLPEEKKKEIEERRRLRKEREHERAVRTLAMFSLTSKLLEDSFYTRY